MCVCVLDIVKYEKYKSVDNFDWLIGVTNEVDIATGFEREDDDESVRQIESVLDDDKSDCVSDVEDSADENEVVKTCAGVLEVVK